MPTPSSYFGLSRKTVIIVLAVLYVVGAIFCGRNVMVRTEASTEAIEQILSTYSMKNEGSLAIDRYAKEHPLMGFFFSSPIKHELNLPSHDESAQALSGDVTALLKSVRHQASLAAWWSLVLLNLSLLFFVTIVVMERSFTARSVLLAMTSISVVLFVIGIFAPAMVIWTAPSIPMESGKMDFVLQHQVRGIAAIIRELMVNGHWIVGGLLLLFSIITPLTKAALTLFIVGCRNHVLNFKIGTFIHNIAKWSMADVFVAGVLLSLFALKAQEATKSIPCLGLYYFIGYCLLSLTTTEVLTHSGLVTGKEDQKTNRSMGRGTVAGLIAGLLCFAAATSGYTYQQYTLNTHEKVTAASSPQKLNNADLVLPAHQ